MTDLIWNPLFLVGLCAVLAVLCAVLLDVRQRRATEIQALEIEELERLGRTFGETAKAASDTSPALRRISEGVEAYVAKRRSHDAAFGDRNGARPRLNVADRLALRQGGAFALGDLLRQAPEESQAQEAENTSGDHDDEESVQERPERQAPTHRPGPRVA
jgi:hypothetical protein